MTGPGDARAARRDAARRGCDRFLALHGRRDEAGELRALADLAAARDTPPADMYGDGGAVAELERRVAGLLGTEAAAFFPSGTMAQQCALRTWADRAGVDTVGMHPLAHLERHESDALRELHHLRPRFLTAEPRQPTVADLAGVEERLGSVVVELPLRDAGYLLPTLAELTAFAAAARARGAAVHLDGARLWESTPWLGAPLDAVAGLADSVYVSFYKVLGAISGAALAGPAELVATARRWRARHGGTLVTSHPVALSALHALDERLPRVGRYVAHAGAVAAALSELEGVRTHPFPPHCNAFRLFLDVDADALDGACVALAEERRVWTFGRVAPAEVPGWATTEFTVGDATLDRTPAEVAGIVAELRDRARGG